MNSGDTVMRGDGRGSHLPAPQARPGDGTLPIIWAMVFSYSATIFLEGREKKKQVGDSIFFADAHLQRSGGPCPSPLLYAETSPQLHGPAPLMGFYFCNKAGGKSTKSTRLLTCPTLTTPSASPCYGPANPLLTGSTGGSAPDDAEHITPLQPR